MCRRKLENSHSVSRISIGVLQRAIHGVLYIVKFVVSQGVFNAQRKYQNKVPVVDLNDVSDRN